MRADCRVETDMKAVEHSADASLGSVAETMLVTADAVFAVAVPEAAAVNARN
jgi:hypothetical protein